MGIDFMSMDPQAPKQENVPEFNDINTWTEQVLAEVLDMENQHQQQQQQQQQQVPSASYNSNKKKKDKENVPPTSSSTPPTGVSRSKSTWPNINLFPSPQPVRRAFSDTGAATSVSIEGVE